MTDFEIPDLPLSERAEGTRVVRQPKTWQANAFDAWERGEGGGVVVESPFPLDTGEVDVRWPAGRCIEMRT